MSLTHIAVVIIVVVWIAFGLFFWSLLRAGDDDDE